MERETGGLRPALNRSEVLSHKYVALVEGVCGTSASRSVAEFGAGSATFWLESPVHELWEGALRPHVHYIPLKRGLDDLEAILQVPGLTGVFIGPNDLSLCLGAEPSSAPEGEVLQTIERIVNTAHKYGCLLYTSDAADE